MNSDIRTRNNSAISAEIEHLKKRLIELENEDLTLNSIYKQEYIEIKSRLQLLDDKQLRDGR